MVRREKLQLIFCGMLIAVVLFSCAGASFNYRYYAYDIENHKLMGATAGDDMYDAVCAPREGNLRPCIVVLTDDFFNLKSDYLKTKEDLIQCEKSK